MARTKIVDRPHRFETRFSDEEQELVNRLSALDGVSAAELLRSLIRREARRVLDWSPTQPKRSTRRGGRS